MADAVNRFVSGRSDATADVAGADALAAVMAADGGPPAAHESPR
ncbi:hypothetical protein ARTSIC4J27_571 [Pseudarthrobacter siccitolerans]|uniref:Uncharacterized protein n=1 Tax=Pseudarthrobacter siccitolerans TaxID=861266 RepID=A0A024GXZ6_9MICC|nr:hypothetical protein ARTSIC4J27_571 [Pseudarthrobacter siccitolerans]